jgi:hypothetical protein
MEPCVQTISWPDAVATVAVCLAGVALILGPLWILSRGR